jgi:hypothetical protein
MRAGSCCDGGGDQSDIRFCETVMDCKRAIDADIYSEKH